MAFISDKERDSLVHKANQSYTGRKIFFFISMAITLVWIILIVVFSFLAQKEGSEWQGYDWFNLDGTISSAGAVFITIAVVVVALDIVSLVLMLCVISPKQSEKVIKKLQSSALSGVKTTKKGTNVAEAAGERMKTKEVREEEEKK